LQVQEIGLVVEHYDWVLVPVDFVSGPMLVVDDNTLRTIDLHFGKHEFMWAMGIWDSTSIVFNLADCWQGPGLANGSALLFASSCQPTCPVVGGSQVLQLGTGTVA
jgi:hypothetical protein